MSIPAIRAAMEAALAAIAPAIAQPVSGQTFRPQADVPNQRVDFIWADPVNPENTATYRQDGVMQVALRYPTFMSADDIEIRAMQIRAAFPRKRTLTAGAIRIVIDRTPSIAAASNDGDRMVRIVRVRFTAGDLA